MLDACDEAAAVRAYRALRSAGRQPRELLEGSTSVAARTLQLRFATPHAMIALNWAIRALEGLTSVQANAVAEACVRFLAASPKLHVDVAERSTGGEVGDADPLDGLERSLSEHRVFDAGFYVSNLLGEGRYVALAEFAMELASRRVGSLGHVLIYTINALKMLSRSSLADAGLVALALSEFLSRRAMHEEPKAHPYGSTLPDLLSRLVERPGLLGHNVILAAEVAPALHGFSEKRKDHILAQLAENVDRSDEMLTAERYLGMQKRPVSDAGGGLEQLVHAFRAGAVADAMAPLAACWRDPKARGALRGVLLALFAGIDAHEPHYLIYPQATFSLAEVVGERFGELAVAQLVALGVDAARREGMRPVATDYVPEAATARSS
jgi:hypothetical protein